MSIFKNVLKDPKVREEVMLLDAQGVASREIATLVGSSKSAVGDMLRGETWVQWLEEYNSRGVSAEEGATYKGPKILTIDIETAPILGNVWRLFKQNVSLNMIERDWYMLSFCAKWKHEDEVIYEDKRDSWDNEDDSAMLESIWHLFDEADIVQGQNSKGFDVKKINARFLQHGMKPPSSYRQVDTLLMAKANFAFTSNKLAYMTEKFCKKYQKLDHGKFAGFELWKECLAGNPEAWAEMQEYNIVDVLSTEELVEVLRPWDKRYPNLNLYFDEGESRCSCGADDWKHSGHHYSNTGKFDKFQCQSCGAEVRNKVNLIPKERRAVLMSNIA